MTDDFDFSGLLDETRSASLSDQGESDYVAVTVVAADGTEHYALALRWGVNDADLVYDTHCHGVGHEQDGPLPGGWRERIWGDLTRCGRLTAAGQPCRRMVSTPGEPCAQHRGQPKVSPAPSRRRYPRAMCPVCGVDVAVAPKRRTFTPHGVPNGYDDQGLQTWSLCPMSRQPS